VLKSGRKCGNLPITLFKGTYTHRIDPKGRLPVPAAFRRALVGEAIASVVVTQLDECLAVYPPSEWARLEQHLRALPAFSRPVKALTRLLMSRAADCALDVQGRILVPAALRAGAGLEREALVIGVLNRFEVWSPERWGAFVAESEKLLDDASLDVQWPLPPASPPGVSPAGHPQEKPRR
jgi:MraZ protein